MRFFPLLLVFFMFSCKTVSTRTEADSAQDTPEVTVVSDSDRSGTHLNYATEESVSVNLNVLVSDDLKGRKAGEEGIAIAAEYLVSVLEKHDVQPYFESYLDTLDNFDGTAYNVVGWVEGRDPVLKNEVVIIGAHYDHIGIQEPVEGDSIANGANDNAAGSTAVLEFAKFFGDQSLNRRSVIFAFFSAEEAGLLGSVHLAKKLKEAGVNVYTMVNFEMIGVPMKRDYATYLTGYETSNMAEFMNTTGGSNLVGLLPKAKEYQLFKRSDNYPFYKQFNIPAQTISTFDFENYAYYHHVDDEGDKLDIVHMTALINRMIPVLEAVINSDEGAIKLTPVVSGQQN
ncbi:M28 family peptidase [Robertkochia solimangrovi]|uniref:M28 family peptidase n=1 Tax=Robertkochia solimangrovi TaxID=2213046 RepID=UPI001180B08D|nr:M28 family peptidase [Robertkochia solimangrovi]TRZ44273.1 peptidase M28 [Robertkochia solimangrovi]